MIQCYRCARDTESPIGIQYKKKGGWGSTVQVCDDCLGTMTRGRDYRMTPVRKKVELPKVDTQAIDTHVKLNTVCFTRFKDSPYTTTWHGEKFSGRTKDELITRIIAFERKKKP